MAYTPIGWVTGDTITADKLNKMDNGWGVESTQLFSETLTTASGRFGYQATMAYAGDPTAISTMTIVFDGTTYDCEQQSRGGAYSWGAPSPSNFSEYPFAVLVMSGTWYLLTETEGTHTVTGRSVGSLEVSDDFTSAVSGIVSSVAQTPFKITEGTTTFNEIYSAVCTNGRFGYIESTLYANQPVLIEPVIYVLKSSSTFSVKTIGFDGSALVIYTYTASSADGVITLSE